MPKLTQFSLEEMLLNELVPLAEQEPDFTLADAELMADEIMSPVSSHGSSEGPLVQSRKRAAIVREVPVYRKSACWFMFASEYGGDKDKAQCLVCDDVLACNGGNTSGLMRHAKSHKDEWADIEVQSPQKPRRWEGSHNDLALKAKERACPERTERAQRLALVKMIVKLQLAHLVADDKNLKEWSYVCGADADPVSRSTVARDIQKLPGTLLPLLKKKLDAVTSKISLTHDMWAAKNGGKYIAITGHWLDDDMKAHELLLWFNQIKGRHTNVELRAELDKCLRRWGLEGRVGAMTSDSAGENIKMMIEYAEETGWSKEWLVRCSNHGQNKGVEAFLEDPEVARLVGMARKQHQYINNYGGARVDWFEDACKQRKLPVVKMQAMNETRWHSAYNLLQDILPCKESDDPVWLGVLRSFNEHYLDSQSKKDKVTWQLPDFKKIRELRCILEPFKLVMMQGEHTFEATLNLTCHYYEQLMDGLDLLIPEVKIPTWLIEASCKALGKLETYYKATGDLYFMATCLDPRMKLSVYSQPKRPGHDDYDKIRAKVIKGLQPYFDLPPVVQPPPPPPKPPSTNRRLVREDPTKPTPLAAILARIPRENTLEKEIQAHQRQVRAAQVAALQGPAEELERYLAEDLAEGHTNPLEWWKLNKGRYPNLFMAARDILAGQSSSAAAERVFSHGGDLITNKRGRLMPETIQNCMLLFYWFDHL